jgi:type IV pilus assembly protein PilP
MRTLSLTVVGLSLIAALARAQTAPAKPAAVTPAATPAAVTPAAPAQNSAEKTGDASEPQGFNYNPDGRRDPFISLLRRGDAGSGPRVAGLGGLGTSEVSLRGILTSDGAFVGILHGVDSKNYIVRVGDKLSDGTIRTITKDSLVIVQQVNDPLSLEKEREVRKLLRQTEEAK